MPLLRRENVRHATLLFCVKGGGPLSVKTQKKEIQLQMSEKIDVHVECVNDYIQAILPFQQKALAQIHRFGTDRPALLFRGDKNDRRLVAKINDTIRQNSIKRPISFERDCLRTVRSALSGKLSDWDAMVLAQHHGVKTRFLDWTSNSLVALFFGMGRDDKIKDCKVWLLETNEDDFDTDEACQRPIPDGKTGRTVIVTPRQIDSRILAQDSYMMRQVYVHDKEDNLQIEPVEDNDTFRGRIHCLSIDFGNAKNRIRNELRQYGCSSESILPIDAGPVGTSWDDIHNKCDALASQYS